MAMPELNPGDEVIIHGTKYTLLYPEMGLWLMCETDNPNASPVIKACSPRSYLESFKF